jgi:hypothetical protein
MIASCHAQPTNLSGWRVHSLVNNATGVATTIDAAQSSNYSVCAAVCVHACVLVCMRVGTRVCVCLCM